MADDLEDDVAILDLRMNALEYAVSWLLAHYMVGNPDSEVARGVGAPYRPSDGSEEAKLVEYAVQANPGLLPAAAAPHAADLVEKIQARVDQLFARARASIQVVE